MSGIKDEEPTFVEIYRARTQQEVAFIRSVLGPEGIAYYIENETSNGLFPLAHGMGVLAMRVMVERRRALEAREILREVLKL